MPRDLYLELARRGLRMPIGTDLVLHEFPDPEGIRHDANRLGAVVEAAARRYATPLAFPLMDLTLEKSDLLEFFGVPEHARDGFHFSEAPSEEMQAGLRRSADLPFGPRMQAGVGAVRYIAGHTGLFPVGMLIGPFSLMTKLVADPIVPVAMAGAGVTAADDEGVRMVERCLDLALATVWRSARAQIAAGAKALIVCEPAANTVYLSPRQMRAGSPILEQFVLQPNRRLRAFMDLHGVDLIFHDCGQLLPEMVRAFAVELRPAMLSLGSSRNLWEDASVVPAEIVLFGNLPSRMFYSDAAMPLEEVRRLAGELASRMAACGHPHILGSECDVLHVPGSAETIRRKVAAMLAA